MSYRIIGLIVILGIIALSVASCKAKRAAKKAQHRSSADCTPLTKVSYGKLEAAFGVNCEILDVTYENNCLVVKTKHNGQKGKVKSQLLWSGVVAKSLPVQVPLKLILDSKTGKGMKKETFYFSLEDLKAHGDEYILKFDNPKYRTRINTKVPDER